MLISFVIINYNTKLITSKCIESIYQNDYLSKLNYEIVIVDNNSSDNSVDYFISKYPMTKVIASQENLGFGKGNNLGVKHAKGKVIVLLNSDTLVNDTNFQELIEILQSNNCIGFLSCKILNEDSTIQSVGFEFPSLINTLKLRLLFWNYNFIKRLRFNNYFDKGLIPVDWISGSFLICNKSVFQSVNGFDENIFMYSEDIDICYRITKKGYKNFVYDKTYMFHLHGKSGDNKVPSLKKMLKNKKNYYYVISKNNICNSLYFIKAVDTMHVVFIWSLKKILRLLKNITKSRFRNANN